MNKVFLGGTCNDTTWRKRIIDNIQVDYFDPVVEDWNEECQAREEIEKSELCNIHLYVITSAMIGVFSIAEVIESSMTQGKQTILHIVPTDFEAHQLKSLIAVARMVIKHGGIAYSDIDIDRTTRVINYCFKA